MSIQINVTVDGRDYECLQEMSVNTFLNSIGKYIPTACFIEGQTEGSRCMVCAVEIDNEIKASCNTLIKDGMDIKTNTLDVLKAREWAIKFLLASHPPLCHCCHKLGECVLPAAQEHAGQYFDYNFKYQVEKTKVVEIKSNILFDKSKCIYCGLCDNKEAINNETCQNCPTGALEYINA